MNYTKHALKKRETIKKLKTMNEKTKNGTFYKMSDNCKQLAIVKNQKDKYVIVCGEYQVTDKEFEDIDNAEEFICAVHYNEIFAMFYVLNKYYNEKAEKANMDKKHEETNK